MNMFRNLAAILLFTFALCVAPVSAENAESDGFVPDLSPSPTSAATITGPETEASTDRERSDLEKPIQPDTPTQIDQAFNELKNSFGAFFRAVSEIFRSLARILSSLFDSLSPSRPTTSGTGVPSSETPVNAPQTASKPTTEQVSEPVSSQQPPSTPQTPAPSPTSGTPNPIPYFCQWDNTIDDFGTCQNTSIAMTLNSLGWDGRPDDITREFGRKLGQTPEGVAQIINEIASRSGLKYRAISNRSSLSSFKSALEKGFPVITHGWFTKSGHVVCVKGYDNGKYIVNDPAGKWDGGMYGSINGWVSGEDVEYEADSFEQAIDDGSVWYTEIVPA